MNKMAKVVFIDDQATGEDLLRYAERLSRSHSLECQLMLPPKLDDMDGFLNEPFDLFLIDYELRTAQADGTKVAYRGSTLATEIRDRRPDFPIVLVTRTGILKQLVRQTRRQLTERNQLWDEIILKSDIDEQLEETVFLLDSLSTGFRLLREVGDKNWQSLVTLLGAESDEANLLREAAPPTVKSEDLPEEIAPPLAEGTWIVTDAANWIRKVVLEFPGILYDPLNAATRLGISVDSFKNATLQELFGPASYAGVFAPLDGRWWKGRLLQIAQEFTRKNGFNGPTNQVFTQAFNKASGVALDPAICIWDHTPIADWVCYLLNEPVKIKHSLRYYPDRRPTVMDSARVSFRAIQESNEFDEELLDAQGLELLEVIRRQPSP